MSATPSLAAAVAATVPRQDHVRLPRRSVDARAFKEWFHFCVSTEEIDALVNFAVLDSAPSDQAAPRWAPRVTVMARRDRWKGSTRAVAWEACDLTPGQAACRMGSSRFFWADGAYRLSAGSAEDPVEVHLVLEPRTLPTLVHNVDLGAGHPLHWLLVPRSRATGSVRIGSDRFAVRGAPAYHDHNWGRFTWQGAFGWEWGCALAPGDGPDWSVVFTRMRDPRRGRTLREGLFVWRAGQEVKVFRGARLKVERHGRHGHPATLRVPPALALACPEGVTDVPEHLTLHGEDGDDYLRVVFTSQETAQILVPHDGETGTTRIQEVAGRVRVEGRLGGEVVDFETRTVVEFLRG